MTNPHNPGVKGNSSVQHDGRPDSSHEKEVSKAGCSHEASETKAEEKSEK